MTLKISLKAIPLALLLGATALSGLSATSASAETKVVGFSHPASQVPIIAVLQELVVKIGAERGLEVLTDNAQLQLTAQIGSVQSWVTQRVAAISVLPLDPAAFQPLQAEADANGTCWTTYAAPMEGSKGLVALSPEQSGQLVADDIVAWIKANAPTGKVLMLTNSSDRVFLPRTEVPRVAIEEQTDAEIVMAQDAVDQAGGLSVAEAALKAHPDLRIVVAFNDDGGLGAARAFKNAGIPPEEVYIIGQDGSQEGLQALLEGGYYKASAAIPLQKLATTVLDVMQNCMDGNEAITVPVDSELLHSTDTDKVKEFLKAYGG